MVQGAANLAKERRADLITRQQRRVAQLNSLRALVQKKEEEVCHKHAVAVHGFPDVSSTASQFTTEQRDRISPGILEVLARESHPTKAMEVVHDTFCVSS